MPAPSQKQFTTATHLGDFWADASAMPGPVRALYALLVLWAGDKGGKVPNDPARMAPLLGYDRAELERLWPEVIRAFVDDGHGCLVHVSSVKQIEFRESRRVNGVKGGRAKAAKTTEPTTSPSLSERAKEAVNVLAEASGVHFRGGYLKPEQASAVENLAIEHPGPDWKLVGDFIGAGQHFLTKRKGETVGLAYLAKHFASSLTDARAWSQRGRPPTTVSRSGADTVGTFTETTMDI